MKKNVIAYYRAKLGLTQNELAQKIGVTQAEISRLEKTGKRRLRVETLHKLADACNIEVAEIMNAHYNLTTEKTTVKQNVQIIQEQKTPIFGTRNINSSINMTNEEPIDYANWCIKKNQFLVQVTTACMMPVILPSQYVLCDRNINYTKDDLVLVQVADPKNKNEVIATVRQIKEIDPEHIVLTCESKKSVIFKHITNKKIPHSYIKKLTKVVAILHHI